MPRVKKMLDDYFKSSKLELGQHLNGDEAMALGAAFRAANLSTAFRVRKVYL
jgi:hypoxia up-regulated 1